MSVTLCLAAILAAAHVKNHVWCHGAPDMASSRLSVALCRGGGKYASSALLGLLVM